MSLGCEDRGAGIRNNGLLEMRSVWFSGAEPKAHSSPVTCLDSHAGSLVTGGYDGRVICWTRHCEPVWTTRFPDLVNAVAVSPEGDHVAAAVADACVYILRMLDGKIVRRVGPVGDDVNDVCWNPTCRGMIAFGCDTFDPDIHLTANTTDGPREVPRRFKGHEGGVFAVAYASRGGLLATGSDDRTVRIWDQLGATQSVLWHDREVEAIAWWPGAQELVTGSDDGLVRRWSQGDNGTWTITWETETGGPVRSLSVSPGGEMIAVGAYDGFVYLYEHGTILGTLRAPYQWERTCKFAGDSTLYVASFGDRPIGYHIKVSTTGKREAALATDGRWRATCGINAVTSSGQGDVYIGTDCGLVGMPFAGRSVLRLNTLVTSLESVGDDERVLVGDYLGGVTTASHSGTQREVCRCESGPVNAIQMLPDHTFTTGGYDGIIRRWSPNGELLEQIRAHRGAVKSLCWSPGLGALVSGSADSTVAAWRIDARITELARLSSPDIVLVNSVAAPVTDCQWVALASRDRHVRLWSPASDEVTVLPRVHEKSIKAIAVSWDGEVIASGGYDSLVCFWYLSKGKFRAWSTGRWHAQPGIAGIAPHARGFVVAGWDGTITRWNQLGQLTADTVVSLT